MFSPKTNQYFLVFVFIVASFFTATAQVSTEQLGGIPSDFLIYSHGKQLDVSNQILIKKDTPFSFSDSDNGTGYGYALNEVQLQWISSQKVYQKRERGKRESYALIMLYSKDGHLIKSLHVEISRLSKMEISASPELPNQYIYNLNLRNIPLLLLDLVHKIDIETYYKGWDVDSY